MPEVQNVGTVDYAQYQPSQYAPEQEYADNYNLEPDVYDENVEEMKAASKSRLGATIATAAIIGGLCVWGGHAWGKKSAAKEINNAKEAIANYEKAQKAMEDAKELANKGAGDWFGTMRCGTGLRDKIEELFKPFKKVAEDVAEGVEQAADDIARNV